MARRLGRLGAVADDRVSLAAALAARAPRLGHVCVDLATVRATADADVDDARRPRPTAMARSGGVAGGSGREPAGGRRPPAAPRGHDAVPRPAVDRRAAGGARLARTRRDAGGRRRPGSLGLGPAPPLRRERPPRSAAPGGGSGGAPVGVGRGRRARHGEDDDGGASAGPAGRTGVGGGPSPSADCAGRADRQGGRSTRGGGPSGRGIHAGRCRCAGTARCPDRSDAAPAPRLQPGQSDPLPAQPAEPSAPRCGGGRRDLHGLAVAHGPAGRGGAARGPTHPGRGPRAAGLGGGGRRAGRHRRTGLAGRLHGRVRPKRSWQR